VLVAVGVAVLVGTLVTVTVAVLVDVGGTPVEVDVAVTVTVGVTVGVIRLVGRSMRGAIHMARSFAGEPFASTVRINFTWFPANGLRSVSTV
jgi:hypothetical protein